MPNPDGQLKVSMTAQVSIVLAEAKDALLVPSSALGKRGKGGVYAIKVLEGEGDEAQVVTKDIQVGLNNRVQAQVLSGLKAGDKVVVGEAMAGEAGSTGRRSGAPRMF